MGIGRGHEVLEGAKKGCASLIQEEDGIGEPFGKSHVVSDHNACKSKLLLQSLNESAESAGDDGINHRCGLIIKNNFGLGGKRPGDGDGAAAAGGQTGR